MSGCAHTRGRLVSKDGRIIGQHMSKGTHCLLYYNELL